MTFVTFSLRSHHSLLPLFFPPRAVFVAWWPVFGVGRLLVCGWWFETLFIAFSLFVAQFLHLLFLHMNKVSVIQFQRESQIKFLAYICYRFWFFVGYFWLHRSLFSLKFERAEVLAPRQHTCSCLTYLCYLDRSLGLLVSLLGVWSIRSASRISSSMGFHLSLHPNPTLHLPTAWLFPSVFFSFPSLITSHTLHVGAYNISAAAECCITCSQESVRAIQRLLCLLMNPLERGANYLSLLKHHHPLPNHFATYFPHPFPLQLSYSFLLSMSHSNI